MVKTVLKFITSIFILSLIFSHLCFAADSSIVSNYNSERSIKLKRITEPITKSDEYNGKLNSNAYNIKAKNTVIEQEKLHADKEEKEYIIKFKQGISDLEIQYQLSKLELLEIININTGIYKVRNNAALNQLKNNKDIIEYIELDYKRKVHLVPNDFYYSNQWNLPDINAQNAWDITTGSSDIIVAVIDSGLEPTHPDLDGKILNGYNYVLDDFSLYDSCGHGTAVSGVLAANGNNGIGIAGLIWNVQILPLHVIAVDGYAYTSDIVEAIYDATDCGAKVINLSLGGPDYSQSMQDAINYAIARNVVVVAAAGNDGTSELNYPAACSGVIGVGSTNTSNLKSDFSQFNASVDVVAPGEYIYSTSDYYTYSTYYDYVDGTSFSAPQVSGLAALMLSINPNLTSARVTEIIENTSVDLGASGRDDWYGFGKINAQAALQMAQIKVSTVDLSTNPVSPKPVGTSITLTATSTGSPNPRYKFWVYYNGAWSVLKDYGPESSITWTPTTVGNYWLSVYARDAGSSASCEALKQLSYSVVSNSVTSVNLTTNPVSPRPVGTSITLSATSTGSPNPRYKFWVYYNGAWSVLKDYGPESSITWTPSVAGDYKLSVYARDAGSSALCEALKSLTYTVNTIE